MVLKLRIFTCANCTQPKKNTPERGLTDKEIACTTASFAVV